MFWAVTAIVLLALAIISAILLRQRAGDIEEVILQGRPILLRCGKLRVEGQGSRCVAMDEPKAPCC